MLLALNMAQSNEALDINQSRQPHQSHQSNNQETTVDDFDENSSLKDIRAFVNNHPILSKCKIRLAGKKRGKLAIIKEIKQCLSNVKLYNIDKDDNTCEHEPAKKRRRLNGKQHSQTIIPHPKPFNLFANMVKTDIDDDNINQFDVKKDISIEIIEKNEDNLNRLTQIQSALALLEMWQSYQPEIAMSGADKVFFDCYIEQMKKYNNGLYFDWINGNNQTELHSIIIATNNNTNEIVGYCRMFKNDLYSFYDTKYQKFHFKSMTQLSKELLNQYYPNFGKTIVNEKYHCYYYLEGLVVAPPYRGKGIGTKIIDFILNHRHFQKQIITLHTKHKLVGNIKFYKRHGFKALVFKLKDFDVMIHDKYKNYIETQVAVKKMEHDKNEIQKMIDWSLYMIRLPYFE